MAKYGVFVDPEGEGYLVDVQADLLADLSTRTVVPLVLQSAAPKALNVSTRSSRSAGSLTSCSRT
jgi:hypothetical protein